MNFRDFLKENYSPIRLYRYLVENEKRHAWAASQPMFQDLKPQDESMHHHVNSMEGEEPIHAKVIRALMNHHDPSPQKVYTAWLSRVYNGASPNAPDEEKRKKKGFIRDFQFEDHPRVAKDLAVFDSPLVKPHLEKKDINQYRSTVELHQAVEEHIPKLFPVGKVSSEAKAFHMATGLETLYDGPTVKITTVKNHAASHALFGDHDGGIQKTSWCTAYESDHNYKHYTGQTEQDIKDDYDARHSTPEQKKHFGLIQIHPKDGTKDIWQLHVPSRQLMNRHDGETSVHNLLDRLPELRETPLIKHLSSSRYALEKMPSLIEAHKGSSEYWEALDMWAEHGNMNQMHYAGIQGTEEHAKRASRNFGYNEPDEPSPPDFEEEEPDSDDEKYFLHPGDPKHTELVTTPFFDSKAHHDAEWAANKDGYYSKEKYNLPPSEWSKWTEDHPYKHVPKQDFIYPPGHPKHPYPADETIYDNEQYREDKNDWGNRKENWYQGWYDSDEYQEYNMRHSDWEEMREELRKRTRGR